MPDGMRRHPLKGSGRVGRKGKAETIDLIETMLGSKKWWESKTLQSLAALIAGYVAIRFGYYLEDGDKASLGSIIQDAGFLVVSIRAWLGRVGASKGIKPEIL